MLNIHFLQDCSTAVSFTKTKTDSLSYHTLDKTPLLSNVDLHILQGEIAVWKPVTISLAIVTTRTRNRNVARI